MGYTLQTRTHTHTHKHTTHTHTTHTHHTPTHTTHIHTTHHTHTTHIHTPHTHTHTPTHTPYKSSVRRVTEKGGLIWNLVKYWVYVNVPIFFLDATDLRGPGRPLSDNTQHYQETDIHVFLAGFEPTVPPSLGPLGHWDRQHIHYTGHM